MSKTPILYCDDGSEIELPWKWAICSHCQGHGTSSAYLSAYTQSDLDAAGPQFFDDFRAGRYDRACDGCESLGRVKIVDWSKLTGDQKRDWNVQATSALRILASKRPVIGIDGAGPDDEIAVAIVDSGGFVLSADLSLISPVTVTPALVDSPFDGGKA